MRRGDDFRSTDGPFVDREHAADTDLAPVTPGGGLGHLVCRCKPLRVSPALPLWRCRPSGNGRPLPEPAPSSAHHRLRLGGGRGFLLRPPRSPSRFWPFWPTSSGAALASPRSGVSEIEHDTSGITAATGGLAGTSPSRGRHAHGSPSPRKSGPPVDRGPQPAAGRAGRAPPAAVERLRRPPPFSLAAAWAGGGAAEAGGGEGGGERAGGAVPRGGGDAGPRHGGPRRAGGARESPTAAEVEDEVGGGGGAGPRARGLEAAPPARARPPLPPNSRHWVGLLAAANPRRPRPSERRSEEPIGGRVPCAQRPTGAAL